MGYWGVLPPLVRGGARGRPVAAVDSYVEPVEAHLNAALGRAAATRLGVLLDLQAHPGGPSGEAHTVRGRGRAWTADDWDVQRALVAVAALAGRYGGATAADGSSSTPTPPALLGLSVVKEPNGAIPSDVPLAFYRCAYAAMRAGRQRWLNPAWWGPDTGGRLTAAWAARARRDTDRDVYTCAVKIRLGVRPHGLEKGKHTVVLSYTSHPPANCKTASDERKTQTAAREANIGQSTEARQDTSTDAGRWSAMRTVHDM